MEFDIPASISSRTLIHAGNWFEKHYARIVISTLCAVFLALAVLGLYGVFVRGNWGAEGTLTSSLLFLGFSFVMLRVSNQFIRRKARLHRIQARSWQELDTIMNELGFEVLVRKENIHWGVQYRGILKAARRLVILRDGDSFYANVQTLDRELPQPFHSRSEREIIQHFQ